VPSEDIFTLLHLPRDAPDGEIKRKYHEAIREGDFLHPDKGGDRARFEKLQEAYERHGGDPAAAAHTTEPDAVTPDAEPYLSKTEVTWTIDPGKPPTPVTVTLRCPGGLDNVSGKFGPEKWAGTFWTLESDTTFDADGDDIFQVTVVPADITSLVARGPATEQVAFGVNGVLVALTIHLARKISAAARDGASVHGSTRGPWEAPPRKVGTSGPGTVTPEKAGPGHRTAPAAVLSADARPTFPTGGVVAALVVALIVIVLIASSGSGGHAPATTNATSSTESQPSTPATTSTTTSTAAELPPVAATPLASTAFHVTPVLNVTGPVTTTAQAEGGYSQTITATPHPAGTSLTLEVNEETNVARNLAVTPQDAVERACLNFNRPEDHGELDICPTAVHLRERTKQTLTRTEATVSGSLVYHVPPIPGVLSLRWSNESNESKELGSMSVPTAAETNSLVIFEVHIALRETAVLLALPPLDEEVAGAVQRLQQTYLEAPRPGSTSRNEEGEGKKWPASKVEVRDVFTKSASTGQISRLLTAVVIYPVGGEQVRIMQLGPLSSEYTRLVPTSGTH
jgi:hypothetical protein